MRSTRNGKNHGARLRFESSTVMHGMAMGALLLLLQSVVNKADESILSGNAVERFQSIAIAWKDQQVSNGSLAAADHA